MNTWTLWTVMCLCSIGAFASSVERNIDENNLEKNSHINDDEQGESHVRSKRTLFLKKKLIGAGILGLGLGLAKG